MHELSSCLPRLPAREGFRSCSPELCCSKYFWAVMFNSASVGNGLEDKT